MTSPLGLYKSLNNYGSSQNPYNSIFNNNKFYYRPISQSNDNNSEVKSPSRSRGTNVANGKSNKDVYDISTSAIIDYTRPIKSMRLKYSDFLYHKDYGVYSNNRLAIVRRFPYGVENDLTAVNQEPISTIVTWIPENEDMINFSFGESWKDSETKDPVSLFDTIFKSGSGFSMQGGLSGLTNGIERVIPLGGVSEALQFELMKKLGINSDASYNNLPTGNPNFIWGAKERELGGLKCNFEFNLKATYVQNFYKNVDPSIVFLDIINNILRFGSSESSFYITGASGKVKEFMTAFNNGQWVKAAGILIGAFVSAIQGLISGIRDKIGSLVDDRNKKAEEENKKIDDAKKALAGNTNPENKEKIDDTNKNLDLKKKTVDITSKLDGFGDLIKSSIDKIGTIVIAKYRIQINSVINSMTGRPSTPWHITIGNPKKPVFSSGDMYIDNVSVKMGSVLSYNDLPSTIEISFTLRNARALGIQEIFDRFNTGGARQYQKINYINTKKDMFESPSGVGGTSSFMEGYNRGIA